MSELLLKFSEVYLKCIQIQYMHSSKMRTACSLPHMGAGRGLCPRGSQIYPKFNLLSLYLTYSNTVKIPNASQMHQKCIRNLSQIQPSLPRSQSLKYYKNQNKHTYFFLYYLYLSQIYPKFSRYISLTQIL